jgi:helicase
MSELVIERKTADSVVNIVLDTFKKNKQILVFVGTKKGAERQADDIAKSLQPVPEMSSVAEDVLSALSKPTKQCERLACIIRKGVAFHHAGLDSRQKDIIEEQFRAGKVRVICCTPTLAYGLDLPAFRAVIRDVKRYGQHGMGFIPVLDYLQMAGRAGRPSFDKYGEAILVADNDMEARDLVERYVNGEPEDIYSKLAVEPVLRTYVLSLIATRLVKTRDDLVEFFSRTFWAYQYKDMHRLEAILDKMVALLQEWKFIEGGTDGGFVSASALVEGDYTPTLIGSRVAQLYLDPLTAHQLIVGIERSTKKETIRPYAILHLLCNRLEMRPVLRVGVKEWEKYQQVLTEEGHALLEDEPTLYDPEFDEFLGAVKTAKMLDEWMDEKTEDFILESFNATPGELHNKLQEAEWLLYATSELAGLVGHKTVIKDFNRVKFRLKYGVKEELLALLQIEGVGRVRARMMFKSGIKTIGDVKKADLSSFSQLLGKGVAYNIKKAVGEDVPVPVPEGKRKGQLGLNKFDNGPIEKK